jgi:hypothetical protein
MSVENVHVEGMADLEVALKNADTKNPIFILFSGSVDPTTGESWCPDCVKGSFLDSLVLFIYYYFFV